MSIRSTFRGLDYVTPDPVSQAGGQLLNDDFRLIDLDAVSCCQSYSVVYSGGTTLNGTFVCAKYGVGTWKSSGAIYAQISRGLTAWTMLVIDTGSGVFTTFTAASSDCPPSGGWSVVTNTAGGTPAVSVSGSNCSQSGFSGYSGFSGKSGFSGYSGQRPCCSVYNFTAAGAGDSNFNRTYTLTRSASNPDQWTDLADVSNPAPSSITVVGSNWRLTLSYFNGSGVAAYIFEQDRSTFICPSKLDGDWTRVSHSAALSYPELTGDNCYDGATGATGATGSAGASGYSGFSGISGWSGYSGYSGTFGGNSQPFLFDTGTTDADPGSGNLRFNNATFASITRIYISNNNQTGTAVSTWEDTFDDSTNAVRGIVTIYSRADSSIVRIFNITSANITGTGYRKLTVTPVLSNGTINNTDPVICSFTRSGDSGTSGAGGADGATGASGYSGFSGISGWSGYSGFSGRSGYSGYSGIPYYPVGILMQNPSPVTVAVTALASGNNDLYTVGANKRAVVSSATCYNSNASSRTLYATLKVSATTYRLTADTVLATVTSVAISHNFIFEAGDVIGINASGVGVNAALQIIEFDNTSPALTARILDSSNATVALYTCPANKHAYPLNNTMVFGGGVVNYCGTTGTPTLTFYVGSGGAAASSANQLTQANVVTTNTRANPSFNAILNATDKIWCQGTATGAIVFIHLVEL